MNRLKIILIILVCAFVYAVPTLALAADPPSAAKVCTAGCWCTSKGGAIKLPSSLGQDACKAACHKVGERVAACAFTVNQLPERSAYCFTKDICTKQNGVLDTKQATDCIPGQNYCFPDPEKAEKVKLNVAIPNPVNPSSPLTLTGDIGEYINSLFSFIIYGGMVIAIVMVMVGGLQYTLGASSKDGVSKGKERIKNGITGLVLLLCVNLIASTVNPYLIKLKVPEFPMVKRIDLIDAASCETMEIEHIIKAIDGKDIPADQKKCGTSGTIVSKKDGGSVAGATSCDYKKCPNAAEGCLGTGVDAKCLRCSALVPGLTGVSPSSGTCKQLKIDNKTANIDGKIVTTTANYCFYTHDPTVIVSAAESIKFVAATGLAGAVTGGFGGAAVAAYFGKDIVAKIYAGACAEANVNCSAIKSCPDYDTKATAFSDLTGGVSGSQSSMENFFLSDLWGDFNLGKLCVENPCGVTGGCMMSTGTTGLGTDCVQSSVGDLTLKGPQDKCPGGCPAGQKCFTDGTTAACATCEEMIKDNKVGGKGIVPSQVVCNQGSTTKDIDFCGYTTDSDANGPACARVALDCEKVKTLGNKACDYYRTVQVGNNSDKDDLGMFRIADGNFGLDYICQKDPCKAAVVEGKSACVYTSNATVADNCE